MPPTIHKTLSIAKEFSDTPGPRYKHEGDFSGEEFLEKLLLPAFDKVRAEDGILLIDLDGTEGYATSFLEAAFGELARKYPIGEVLARLDFKCDDEPGLVQEIRQYIQDARNRQAHSK
jgi:hypothetical protein